MIPRKHLLKAVLTFFLLSSFRATAQDNDQLFDGINLIFAVDISGSMYERIEETNHDDLDRSARYLMERLTANGAITTRSDYSSLPTDPNNLRFETLEFTFEWLQTFAQRQDQPFEVNVRLVVFDQTATVQTPWVNLNSYDFQNPAGSLDYTPPTNITSEANSDFVNLYDTLAELEPPPSGNHRNILMTITDSLPCNPLSGDSSCGNRPPIQAHIDNLRANRLANFAQYLLIIPPTDGTVSRFEAVSEIYHEFDPHWEAQLGNSKYLKYTSLDTLPSTLFETLVLEIGSTLGIGSANPNQIFASLGLNPAQDSLQVPPYLTEMEVIVILPSGETSGLPIFEQNGREMPYTILDTRGNGVINWLKFQLPPPGTWRIAGETTLGTPSIWSTFVVAEANLTFKAGTIALYEPVEIEYQLLDSDQKPLPIQEDYPLNFDFVLLGPAGSYEIQTLSPSGTAYRTSFAALAPGTYTLSGTVTPDENWANGINLNYDFLNPANEALVQVNDATWSPRFGSNAQDGILSMSRRDPVEVDLSLLQNTAAIPIPTGTTATLSFAPPNDDVADACPTERELIMTPAPQARQLTASLRFPEGGECVISLEVTLEKSEALRITGNSVVVYPKQVIGRVNVSTTSRLSVVIPDEADGNIPIENDPKTFNLEMQDYVGTPQIGVNNSLLTWEKDALTLRLLMQDEDGNPINPEFEGFQTIATTSDEETIITDAPIPFLVTITRENQDQNLALSQDITIVKSSQTGYYLLTIQDLEPGKYELEISLNTQSPPLRSDFEYAPSILQGVRPGAQPTFRASLIVSENQWVVRIRQALWVAGGLALLTLLYQIIRVIRTRLTHLKGSLAIYKRAGDNLPLEPVFELALPRKITYEIPPDTLPQYPLAIDKMVVTTRASRKIAQASDAWVTLVIDGQEKTPKYLKSGQFTESEPFHIDEIDKTHYYLIKDKQKN